MNVTTHRTRVFIKDHAGTKTLVMIRNFGPNQKVLLLPGGGVDDGETARQSMLREVKEELNLELTSVTLVHQHVGTRPIEPPERKYWPNAKTVTNHFDFFVATVAGRSKPSLKEPEKFDRFDWIGFDEIEAYAKKYNATISDGILDVAKMISPGPIKPNLYTAKDWK